MRVLPSLKALPSFLSFAFKRKRVKIYLIEVYNKRDVQL